MSATPAKLPADAVKQDFVYCGRRMGASGQLIDSVRPLNADGKLGSESLFKGDRAERVVGGIYTGTHFSPTTCYGLRSASFTGSKWTQDRAKLVEWEAKSVAAKHDMAATRLEKDERKQSLIEQEMKGLRELYRSALSRGDYSTAHALEIAVLRALKRPPPKT